MRPVLYFLTFLSVIALGFWAYRENYATQASLREVRKLQREITDLREALSVQKAEWAYLNRPERLREMVNLNFDSLMLLPMDPSQFGDVAEVVYPVPVVPAIPSPEAVGPEAVVGDIAASAQAAEPREEEGL